MKLWVDDVRPCPHTDGSWFHARSVNQAKGWIKTFEMWNNEVFDIECPLEVIDIDHDAGEFAKDGGDYIRLLDWLEETGRSYPIHIHSMNPVGVQNMRRIIEKNEWTEV